MKKLQDLLLFLTNDVVNINELVKNHLSEVTSIDVLVDIDIVKDFKSKLIIDIIELDHSVESDDVDWSKVQKGLHDLMCFYSEYVDRCVSLIRNFSSNEDIDITSNMNMTGINTLLFNVFQDIRKMEKIKCF